MATDSARTYFRPTDIRAGSNQRAQAIIKNFTQKINTSDYPCVGAKSAVHTDQYRFGIYGKMGDVQSTLNLGKDLKTYLAETKAANSQYMSMIAVFSDQVTSELDFEEKLWLQLQELHDGEKNQQLWDPSVGSNPEANDFSFSFAGTAFFIVGLHPCASRRSRRFDYPALAFNLHHQFEQLRDHALYEKMKKTIRDREIKYDGAINPMLHDHGAGLEAPQYSGRQVDSSWKCPFHP